MGRSNLSIILQHTTLGSKPSISGVEIEHLSFPSRSQSAAVVGSSTTVHFELIWGVDWLLSALKIAQKKSKLPLVISFLGLRGPLVLPLIGVHLHH